MKKKLLVVLMIAVLAMSMVACGSKEKETSPEETTKTEVAREDTKDKKEDTVLNVGDTWTVDGQWEITVNSITATDERIESDEYTPEGVYIIDYTYKNLGFEDEYSDGLYVDLSMGQVVDKEGYMGYSYYTDIDRCPQSVPVGAICNAKTSVGVDNAGDFKIIFMLYDGNEEMQKATFNFSVEEQ